MITLEEAKILHDSGVYVAGMQKLPDFSISTKTDRFSSENTTDVKQIEALLNNNLRLSTYIAAEKVTNLFYTYIVIPPHGKGVNWKERKYYSSKRKFLYIDIRFPDYKEFCEVDKDKALRIMAFETLRATREYLPKIKEFDFQKYYNDLSALLEKQQFLSF